MAFPPEMLGAQQRLGRKQVALQQIHTAIRVFGEGDFASAITLALAAEDALPKPAAPYLFGMLQSKVPPDRMAEFNEIRNWLKHERSPEDERVLYEFEVFIALARATTKFHAVHCETTPEIDAFEQWARERGYAGKSERFL